MRDVNWFAGLWRAAAVLAVAAGLGATGCDDFNSMVACQQYCTRNFECIDVTPSDERYSDCVANCRNSIEDRCGDENQAAANDHIFECVDQGCAAFWTCMVFSAAPECYGFVTDQL